MVNWDGVLRQRRGLYEAGALDASGTCPGPPKLSATTGALAEIGTYVHECLRQPAWRRRQERVYESPR
jgi:hypothetical protein